VNEEGETQTRAALPGTTRRRRRRWLRPLLLGAGPLLVALGAAAAYLGGGRYVETDNAYVKADKVAISAEVAGTVRAVPVRENQRVGAGEVLFRIDDAPFRVAVARARAYLARVANELAAMKAGYRQKQSEIDLAQTNLAYADREYRRQAGLADRGFISPAALDDHRLKLEQAQRNLATRQEELRQIAANLGGSADLPVEQHPSWLAARADLERAQLDLARVEVRAPIDGIASKPPKPGQYLAPGTSAMALVGTSEVWIEANYTETDLTYVRPGQQATIEVDTYPGRKWTGEVDSISPATGAEFSVLPAQNATGNWVKVTQRVPVRIAIRGNGDDPALRAGMSATVSIDTGHRRTLFGFSWPARSDAVARR
jgi:membrane fusion protein (multidrug efflux system)